jgi:asparagine synthase (glutamine-hydrolysing)
VRAPFLDVRLASRALRLGAAVKRPAGRPKGLLVDAVGHRLPGWLRQRRKQPFTAPVRAWMRGPLRELAHDLLLGPSARTRALVRADRYLRDLDPGAPDADARALRAWTLLQLEVWLRTFARRMGPETGR